MRDLLRIAEAFYLNDTLMEISDTEHYNIPATSHNNPHDLYTIIYTGSPSIAPGYYYEGCRGIKTGTTTPAGRCLMVTCEREDMEVIAIAVGCPRLVSYAGSDWSGHYAAIHQLLNYAYDNYDIDILREVYADEVAARVDFLQTPEPNPVPVTDPEPVEPDVPVETPPVEPDVPLEPDVPVEPTDPIEPEAPVIPAEPIAPVEPEPPVDAPEDAPADEESDGLPWYAWLLLGLAALLIVYTTVYIIQNVTRPMRRRRASAARPQAMRRFDEADDEL